LRFIFIQKVATIAALHSLPCIVCWGLLCPHKIAPAAIAIPLVSISAVSPLDAMFGGHRAFFLAGDRLMDSGYYAAFTGLIARMDALDVVANNLANVSTVGFRGQHEFYEAVTANAGTPTLTPLNVAINNYGVLGGSNMDLQQGSLQSTGNSLDLGIRGAAFFAVQTPRGTRYTRNGSFHVSAAGQIVTQDGDAVLGPAGPIQVPQGAIDIASDGTVSVANAVTGQIRLASFAPGTDLTPEGNTNFTAPEGSEKPSTDSTMQSGTLEASNLSAVKETVTLMVLQRHTELLERTLSVFLDDFNRTAVQDLARD
jgi:flagellar basal-body rod protein FlgF